MMEISGEKAMADGSVGLVTTAAEIRALDRLDEYERTRHSCIFEGVEIGFIRPTQTTEKRLRPNPLDRLLANEWITEKQKDAGLQIAEIYEGITSSMLARAGSGERIGRGNGAVPDKIANNHATRYLPWAYYLGGRPHGSRETINIRGEKWYAKIPYQGRCRLALDIAVAVCVEGATLSEIESAMHWRHGTKAKEYIRYALRLYCDIAGWEQNRDQIAGFEAMLVRKRAA